MSPNLFQFLGPLRHVRRQISAGVDGGHPQTRERGPPSAPAENLINIMYDEVALNFEQACMFK